MHSRLIAFIGLAGFLFVSPALAADDCCAAKAQAASHACCDMPCCQKPGAMAMADAIAPDLPFAMPIDLTPPTAPQATAPQATAPARQATVVWFLQPVKVGEVILQGRYVIEHDADRMARGEPCTHIYAFDDQKTPVVAFHCTHLDRPVATENIVVLHSTADGYKKLVEFQFAGETAAHGFPTVR